MEIHSIGGPTVLIKLAGLRLLTDPTFDPPGDYPRPGRTLRKTAPPRLSASELGRLDAVLLSHDEHPDNLDHAGRALLATVPVVYTTPSGADRLGGNAQGLAPWTTVTLTRPDGGTLTVTSVPARHGPPGCETVTGEVIGFVLSAPDLPSIYISGDNAALELVEHIAYRCGPIDTAILFAGAARIPLLDAPLTLTSTQAAQAAVILCARHVLAAHVDSWAHFTEGPTEFHAAFITAGIADRLLTT